ncbi:MAG: hypothetical protein JNK52_15460 [Zoogloeaceae bacterium]|nr:hypothetical protein [Zoogloeaceae bacterium]
MIRALITGDLFADPQQRTSKNGKPFALARVSVPMGDEGRVSCSLIVFEPDAVARLLQLRAGASLAAAGVLKVGIWQAKDGPRPSLDMVADEVCSSALRPKRPKPEPAQRGHQGGAAMGDALPDDDSDLMEPW